MTTAAAARLGLSRDVMTNGAERARDLLLGPGRPAGPDLPAPNAEVLANADRVLHGRFLLVGEEYTFPTRIPWRRNPSHDKEWQIAWHKHYFAMDLVHALSARGDRAYLSCFEDLVGSWLDEMGSGHITLSDAQVEAKRIESWVTALRLLGETPARREVDPHLVVRLVERIGREATYVSENLKAERNHRTFQLYAVVLAGILYPELDESSALVEMAVPLLVENLLTDILPDGVHVEGSSHYHQIVMETAVGFLELVTRNGIDAPPELIDRVHRGLGFSMRLQLPDGHIPLISDSDDGVHTNLLERGAALFDDPELLWAATLGARGRPPDAPSRRFGVSGYAVLSDGWGSDPETFSRRQHLFYDGALLGEGSHSHYDLFSFSYHAGARPLVVDPGRYTYSSVPDPDGVDWRHWFKSTAAHNTVVVDGRDQTRYLSRTKHGPEVQRSGTAHAVGRHTDWIVGSAHSAEYAPVHERLFVYMLRQYVIVLDRLTSDDGAAHDYDLRFHLPSQAHRRAVLDVRGAETVLRTGGGEIRVAADGPTEPALEDGWVSHMYGVKDPAPVLSVRRRAAGDTVIASTVAPLDGRFRPRRLRLERTDGAITVRVLGDTAEDVVVLSLREDAVTSPAGCRLHGQFAAFRRDASGRVMHLVGHGVEEIAIEGGPALTHPRASDVEWSYD